MSRNPNRRSRPMTPLVLTLGVLFFLYAIHWMGWNYTGFGLFRRLEWMTFDWRVRLIESYKKEVAHEFAGVFIDDPSILALNQGAYGGIRMRPPWPRRVYGDLVRTLKELEADQIAFDILFAEREPTWEALQVDLGQGIRLTSDEYFAWAMQEAGNVIIAGEEKLLPNGFFERSALTVGHIQSAFDHGVRRRFKPFISVKQFYWHPSIEHMSKALGFDLDAIGKPEPGTTELIFDLPGGGQYRVPMLPDGSLDLNELGLEEDLGPQAPFEWRDQRIWHMGLVMGSLHHGVDLNQAQVTESAIFFPSPDQGVITLPLDNEGYAYCDWSHSWKEFKKRSVGLLSVLQKPEAFIDGANGSNPFKDKIVIIGSSATGSNMSDVGTTPLENNAVLTIQLVNVARSMMQNQFITPFTYHLELLLITFLGGIASVLTWKLRAIRAAVCILLVMGCYTLIGLLFMAYFHFWLPLFFPIFGALLMMHAVLVTYRVVFEQKEQRRVKAIFSKVVSPNVVNELLDAERLNLGGRSEEVTVLFTDIRGFTRLTDHLLGSSDSTKNDELEQLARDTLATVNLYLTSVANMVKEHNGTLDKYMGDCVMAFWGAPSANPQHALSAVQSAIESQRALKKLNDARVIENQSRQSGGSGEDSGNGPKLMLPILSMGTGINTGRVTVGLMGSEEHILNYTVFGREVNLASRLEGAAGPGKILVSESTYRSLERLDPGLAATCILMEPIRLKGIAHPVKVYEVPWDRG